MEGETQIKVLFIYLFKNILRYCSDVCSGATCHKCNKISSCRNEYLSTFFIKTNYDHLIYEPQDTQ